jgi:hypothetical protein
MAAVVWNWYIVFGLIQVASVTSTFVPRARLSAARNAATFTDSHPSPTSYQFVRQNCCLENTQLVSDLESHLDHHIMVGVSASAISVPQGHSPVIGRYLDPTVSLLSVVF